MKPSYFRRYSRWAKKNRKNIIRVVLLLLLLSDGVWVYQHHAQKVYASGGPQAVTVYGQAGSFTSGTANNGGASATSLSGPRGVVFDSSGNLYVTDTANNRVLYYPAGTTTATRVYGQGGSFTTTTANTGGISATSLDYPTAVALDSSGNLYVADDANHRVLYYASGSTTATRVYGQAGSFTTATLNNGGTSTTSLDNPNSVALDSSNNLYVADYNNNRVLYYASGSTTATRVYGQGGIFTTGTVNKGGISATSLDQPNGVTLDSSNDLYVADYSNNRVLYYASGSTTATRVYGQNGSFTTGTVNNGGISATSLYQPTNLDLDSSNDLYITDDYNNRVLYFPSGTTTATRVYGQAGSFTTNTANNGGISAASLDQPFAVTIDSSGNIYVSDFVNNRLFKFQTSLSMTTQPPTSSPSQGTFSAVASLVDVGSGSVFSDFTGTVSAAIKSGTGTSGATLGGTTSVSASSGVATFSNLYIDLTGSGYILTLSSPGIGSTNTTTFAITGALGPQAVAVYGQSGSFTVGTASGFYGPRNSVADSSGNLYIADTSHHRVLYYPSGSTTATRVYGQAGSFTTTTANNGGESATSLNHPFAVALDSSNNLYIADTGNNRVLYFPSGTTTATRVYGQNGSFTTALVNNTSGTANTVSTTSLSNPIGVALDSSNNVYISDNGNNRILYYAGTSTTATRVYGQNGSFTTALVNNTSGTANTVSATSLNQAVGIGLDSTNNLYVIDGGNNRTLYYAGTSTTATRVYGQNGSFTTALVNNTSGTANTVSATSLSNPEGLTLDNANNLYITDNSNNRVLYYPSGSTTATRVYGQAGSFTSALVDNTSGTANTTSATSLDHPYGVAIDNYGNIYITDYNNNRVLEFQTALSITTQPPSIVPAGTAFSTTATLIDVGSGATFTDFSGTVSVAIASGTGGAVLSGTTSVSASSGVATFSNLSLNLTGSSYTLTLSSPGTDSATTSAFGVLTPAGYWHFDEDSGTTAYDSSGNNNSGTLTSGPTWAAGEINSGLSFNGTSNYVKTGISPSALQFGTNSFTVMNWFKTSSTASFNRMVSMGAQSNSTGYFASVSPYPTGCIGCVGGGIGATTGTAAASIIFYTTSPFNDGAWHQEAMVVDQTAKTIQVYIDGVAQTLVVQTGTCGTASGTSISISSCSSLSASNAAEAFTIGSHNGVGEYFHGSLDEVRLYNGALNSSQVQTLYNNDLNALSEYAANASFSGTVNSTTTYTLPISVGYQLTPAPGWNLTITSTTLTSGSNTLPTSASKITSVANTCTSTCTPTTMTNTISNFPMTLPAGTTAPTAVKFFGTAASSGTGAYTVTPTFSVTIPITAKTGVYSSTIILTATTGP